VKGTCRTHAIVCISLNSLVPARSCVLIGGDFTKDIVATLFSDYILYEITITVNSCVFFDHEKIYKFIGNGIIKNVSYRYRFHWRFHRSARNVNKIGLLIVYHKIPLPRNLQSSWIIKYRHFAIHFAIHFASVYFYWIFTCSIHANGETSLQAAMWTPIPPGFVNDARSVTV